MFIILKNCNFLELFPHIQVRFFKKVIYHYLWYEISRNHYNASVCERRRECVDATLLGDT